MIDEVERLKALVARAEAGEAAAVAQRAVAETAKKQAEENEKRAIEGEAIAERRHLQSQRRAVLGWMAALLAMIATAISVHFFRAAKSAERTQANNAIDLTVLNLQQAFKATVEIETANKLTEDYDFSMPLGIGSIRYKNPAGKRAEPLINELTKLLNDLIAAHLSSVRDLARSDKRLVEQCLAEKRREVTEQNTTQASDLVALLDEHINVVQRGGIVTEAEVFARLKELAERK